MKVDTKQRLAALRSRMKETGADLVAIELSKNLRLQDVAAPTRVLVVR